MSQVRMVSRAKQGSSFVPTEPDQPRGHFLACVRNEKGHSAVGRHMILHMSRVKRVTKLFGISFWHVSAMKRVTQLLEGT